MNIPSDVTFYQVLGVTPQATKQQIKGAYKKLAILTHPDKNSSTSEANSNFQKLGEAYETLIDFQRRRDYDALLREQHVIPDPVPSSRRYQHQWAPQAPPTSKHGRSERHYWGEDFAKFHSTRTRKPEWESFTEDWEHRTYSQESQDWYKRWDREDTELKERQEREREAAEARAKKLEEERRAMNWLLQQQKILLVIVRLGIEIGVAEASKGGSHTEGEDTTSIDVPEEDLEDHTIFSDDIKFSNLKKDLQRHLYLYHDICKKQRKMGYEKEASSAERDLEAARDRPRAGKKLEKERPPKPTATTERTSSQWERTQTLYTQEANVTKESPMQEPVASSHLKEDWERATHRGKDHKLKQSNVRTWLANQNNIHPSNTSAARLGPEPITPPAVENETPPLIDIDTPSLFRTERSPKPSGTPSETDPTSHNPTPPSLELRALHLSHVDVHQDYWEIVEDDDQFCCMCETYGTLLQCPECEIQACSNCKSALSAPGGTFGPRAKADWNR